MNCMIYRDINELQVDIIYIHSLEDFRNIRKEFSLAKSF